MILTPATLAELRYARRSHFAVFRDAGRRRRFALFGGARAFRSFGPLDPDTCDLKVYQDHLAHLLLRDTLGKGARVLEVGGGDSRVLKHLSRTRECWNVDRCEGLGNGPVGFASRHFRMVYDYFGSGNPDLPASYFDCIFSISALEHMPEDEAVWAGFLADTRRVLKPGGISLHLFDVVLNRPFGHWFHGLISYLARNVDLLTPAPQPEELLRDPDLYVMSKVAYEASWLRHVKEPYEQFGLPSSVTLCWRG
jgi:SAM-dependent methyltransferase